MIFAKMPAAFEVCIEYLLFARYRFKYGVR